MKKALLILSVFVVGVAGVATIYSFTAAPVVAMRTNMGDIIIELYPDEAPVTVENFLQYVEEGYYNNTIVHRIEPNFVIQAGGYDPQFEEKPTRPPIVNESDNGLSNVTGSLSMARLPTPDSATSQFFINLVDNTRLDHSDRGPGYAVFGKVSKGMDVVEAIAALERGGASPMHRAAPTQTVLIARAERLVPLFLIFGG